MGSDRAVLRQRSISRLKETGKRETERAVSRSVCVHSAILLALAHSEGASKVDPKRINITAIPMPAHNLKLFHVKVRKKDCDPIHDHEEQDCADQYYGRENLSACIDLSVALKIMG